MRPRRTSIKSAVGIPAEPPPWIACGFAAWIACGYATPEPVSEAGQNVVRPSPERRPRPPARRGFTLTELMVTAVLVGTVLATLAPVLRWVAAEHRAAARYELALREADNALERVASRPWDGITPEAASEARLSDSAAAHLPGSRLLVTVGEPSADDGGRQVTVEVSWNDSAGTRVAPVRLTTWVYGPAADER